MAVVGLGGVAGLPSADATNTGSRQPAADPVVAAAGDIACEPGQGPSQSTCRHSLTANLLSGVDALLALGDLQYEDGALAKFQASYDATWGVAFDNTFPAPGNHEYATSGATGYYAYWASRSFTASPGYYSFNLGAWHLISLNSEIAHAAGSPQVRWLHDDLRATTQSCILAYWHRARFSSGSEHGNGIGYQPFWDELYAVKADVVLSAHDHHYERFALQDPVGNAGPQGIREFVVGTGGKDVRGLGTVQPNSEIREANTYGVLKLTLRPNSYRWDFVPEAGMFSDFGETACHAGTTSVRRPGCRAGFWVAGRRGGLRYICLRRWRP
jgi:calcineurin-like phosphoesterase family protein